MHDISELMFHDFSDFSLFKSPVMVYPKYLIVPRLIWSLVVGLGLFSANSQPLLKCVISVFCYQLDYCAVMFNKGRILLWLLDFHLFILIVLWSNVFVFSILFPIRNSDTF